MIYLNKKTNGWLRYQQWKILSVWTGCLQMNMYKFIEYMRNSGNYRIEVQI